MMSRIHRTVRAWIPHRVRAGDPTPQRKANCGAIDSDTDLRGTASPTATACSEEAPNRWKSLTSKVIPETSAVEPRWSRWVVAPADACVGRLADRCR